MILLWTDTLFLAMLLGVLTWFFRARKNPYWKDVILRVRKRRGAMMSFFVIVLYLLVATLDSIHFRSDSGGGRLLSVLDVVTGPLHRVSEKSYSAPLALRGFNKMMLTDSADNRFDYPSLSYSGTTFWGGSQTSDILLRLLLALLISLFLTLLWRKLSTRGREKKSIAMTLFFGGLSFVILSFALLAANYHLFGTDKTGTDVFYVALKSVRTGLVIGTLTTIIVTPFAIFFGVVAGYFGGVVDDVIQYIYTTLSSIPSILLIAAVMLIVQTSLSAEETILTADRRLVYLCLVMGVTSWTGLARVIRGEVLKLREIEFVQAAKVIGVSPMKIVFRHLTPNVLHLALISIILQFSSLVLAEAVLAYVGIGVDPSMQSWGNMINSARMELAREPVVWWNLTAAFIFMMGLVLPANIFADAVRDALDPKLRNEQ